MTSYLGLIDFEDIPAEVSNPVRAVDLAIESTNYEGQGRITLNELSYPNSRTNLCFIHNDSSMDFQIVGKDVFGTFINASLGKSKQRWQPDVFKTYGDRWSSHATGVNAEGQFGYIAPDEFLFISRFKTIVNSDNTIKVTGNIRSGDAGSAIIWDDTNKIINFNVVKSGEVHNWIIKFNVTPTQVTITGTTYAALFYLPVGQILDLCAVIAKPTNTQIDDILANPFTYFDTARNELEGFMRSFKRPSLSNLKSYYRTVYYYWFSIMPPVTGSSIKYSFMTPSKLRYVGSWMWDTAFHMIGILKGTNSQELFELNKKQVSIFGENASPDGSFHSEIHYYNTPNYNSQPPGILTWASWLTYEKTLDISSLETDYYYLEKNNNVFFNKPQRPFVWEPGASGWDNSPRWDNNGASKGALDLNCWLYLDCLYLKKMAQVLGKDYSKWDSRMAELIGYIQSMWDSSRQIFTDITSSSQFNQTITPVCFWPMFVRVATQEQAAAMVPLLTDSSIFNTPFRLPSVARNDSTFSNFYWRGPVWTNLNFITAVGLMNYGYVNEAISLMEDSLELVSLYPEAYEYYGALDGEVVGASGNNPAQQFGWTSALNIAMANILNEGDFSPMIDEPSEIPFVCTEGVTRCNGDIKQQCQSNSWVDQESCAYGCSDGECQSAPLTCVEGLKRCNGNTLQECQNNIWTDIETCSNGCSNGACNPDVVCNEGQVVCNGDIRQQCQNNQWNPIETCPNGCQNGECQEVTVICTENETRCNGSTLQECQSNDWVGIQSCAYGCSNNECNAPPTSECTNGQFQCNGNVRQFCSNGQWINTETCAYGCTDGVCNAAPPPGCTDGTFRCNGNVRQMCIGGEWIDIDTCANGCSGGECQEPPACTDGQSRCNGNYRQVCINGSYIDIESCENGCSNGQCSEQPAQNNNTMLYVIGGVALLGVLGSMMAMRK